MEYLFPIKELNAVTTSPAIKSTLALLAIAERLERIAELMEKPQLNIGGEDQHLYDLRRIPPSQTE